MDFGIMFFSSVDSDSAGGKYDLLLQAARFADEHDFVAVWTPERHFHAFGGLFPNPSVTSAAIAAITRRISIRAGSLISPLHDPIRIVEEWSVVDNLSGGRVAISFGSGWNANDFVFFPERYEKRQEVMYRQIETVRSVWRGQRVRTQSPFGKDVELGLYPRPVQPELPVWVTSSGNPETFASAGAIGANLLTHLIGQDLETLGAKIARYRSSRADHGLDPASGIVTLMLHTFVGDDQDQVREVVRTPFREYIRSAVSLEQLAAQAGGAVSGGHRIEPHEITERVMEDLLDLTFERYFETGSLLGTIESNRPMVLQLMEIGVDEIACLIDFGAGALPDILASLERVDVLRRSFSRESLKASASAAVSDFNEPLE